MCMNQIQVFGLCEEQKEIQIGLSMQSFILLLEFMRELSDLFKGPVGKI